MQKNIDIVKFYLPVRVTVTASFPVSPSAGQFRFRHFLMVGSVCCSGSVVTGNDVTSVLLVARERRTPSYR